MRHIGAGGARMLVVVALFAPLANIPAAPASALTPSVTAGDYGYPYPHAPDCDEITGTNCLPDRWGFVQGQCHSWVAYRLNELNPVQLHGATFDDDWHMPVGQHWGNPSNWKTAAAAAGVTMNSTPALGSIAWWSANGAHAAYVEAVNPDGSITISEMNPDYHNGFDFATLYRNGRWPEAFIHIADRPAPTTPTVFSIAVNGSSSSSVPFGSSATLSESGIASAARGPVVFASPGHSNLCTIMLPATSCVVQGTLELGPYSPITATFTDTDGAFSSASSSNSVSLVVTAASTSFAIAVNGGSGATVSRGTAASFSRTALPANATGTVTFSTPTEPELCTITLPDSSCACTLAIGAHAPITAVFADTDGHYGSSVSTNSVALTVTPVAPGAPSAPLASLTSGVATVRWSAPVDDGGAAVSGYAVVVSPSGKVVSTAASTRSVTISGLSAGTYAFKVRAVNSAGASAYSTTSNIVVVSKSRAGYWMLGADGAVYAFGDSVRYGDAAQPMVAMAARRDGRGYWTVDARGRVHSFGAATAHGGSPALLAGESVSTISATPSGNGYWLFTNRGRAFRFGDAHVFGDMSKVQLNGPIIASAATPSGKGYYMVGSDGGVFSFGDARFHGSTGALHLNQPIVGISPTPDNLGYWLVASDGGVFAFNASFRGSMGHAHLNRPVNGLVAFGNGYLMVASDGGIFNFSNRPFFGSLAAAALPAPIIGIAAFAT